MVMMILYRRYLIPGALIALMIDNRSAPMVGVALAAGSPALMYEGVERLVFDILLIVAGGVVVVLLKQALVRRRAPMV